MTEGETATARRPLIEIVPNFSEGRRRDVIDAIVAACQVPGAVLVNTQWDPDHNRLDCSLIGDADAVRRSALAAAAKAVELIDMDVHRGSHPRMGAVDVIPFIPLRDVTMADCVELARDVAREIGESLGLPVYLYDEAAVLPERKSLAEVRKGEYEGLKADVAEGKRLPDFGPHKIGKAGAVAVGARKPLIAFNVYFRSDDEDAVKDVAKRVRESSGGLKNVRAIGFRVPERGLVEVSMNLVDSEATPMHRALELVRGEAARHGLTVESTEIVGLVPLRAVADTAQFYLQLEGWSADEQILESLVDRAGGTAGDIRGRRPLGERSLGGVLEAIASSEPTPGGGSAAALAGATGAALVAMVARLTAAKKGHEATEARMRQIVAGADAARAEFLELADRDAAAFDEVMGAYRLPKESDSEKAARSTAIQRALRSAAEVPMRVSELAVSLLDAAREATVIGIRTAASDGAAAGQLLFASAQAALRNVEINVASMKDPHVVRRMRESAGALQARSEDLLAATNEAFRARLS